jgi:methylated-DNA-protein-cysteine methyltransferase related protein
VQHLLTGKPMTKTTELEALVWQIATYGQIAHLAGMPQQARLVGRILSRLPPDTRLPWHRVVNSRGEVSNPNLLLQCGRLKEDGISVDRNRVSLRLYQWQP